jgi:GNAT superfamily N-acetyltransferase
MTQEIFSEYAEQVGVDLRLSKTSQPTAATARQIRGPPNDALFLAMVGQVAEIVHCGPYQQQTSNQCSGDKRLYVRQPFRQLSLGRQLVETVLDAARIAGYHGVCSTQRSDMESARALSELGFTDIHNPLAGSHYLKRFCRAPGSRTSALTPRNGRQAMTASNI